MSAIKNTAMAVAGLSLAFGATANAAPVRASSSLPSSMAVSKLVSAPVKRSGARVTDASEARGRGLIFILLAAAAIAAIVIIASDGSSSG